MDDEDNKNIQPENKIDERLASRFNPKSAERSAGKTQMQSASGDVAEQENFYNPEPAGVQKEQQRSFTEGAKVVARKKSLWALILFFLGGGGFFTIFSGFVGPIAVVENMVSDLDDKLASYQLRDTAMARNRFAAARDKQKIIKGCTTISLRCKFATIGTNEEARFKRAGVIINGEKVSIAGFGSRKIAESYEFRGKTYTAGEMTKALRTDRDLFNAVHRANNMKFISYADKAFTGRVLERFGLSKKPPGLKGSTKDRLNQLLTAAKTTSASDLKFTAATDADGKPIDGQYTLVDAEGKPVAGPYTEAQKAKIEKNLANVKATKVPPKGLSELAGAASILGYWDVACSINNILGAGTVAAKVAANRDMVKYGWDISSRVHQIKAGDGTVEDGQLIGEFWGNADARREVLGLTETAQAQKAVYVDNPDYGKSAYDSELIKMSLNGGVAPITQMQKQFSLGFGMRTLLYGLTTTSKITDIVTNLGPVHGCEYIQNWAVRGIGIGVSVVAAIFSGGTITSGQVAVTAGLIAGMFIVSKLVNNAISGSPLDVLDDENEAVGRGDATWTGMASLESISAQSVGMQPGNAEELQAYSSLAKEVNDQYIALEADGASPLDATKQGTFLGSTLRSMYKNIGFSLNATTLSRIPSVIASGLMPNVGAEPVDPSRFKRCDDKDLFELGIDADVQCNVRYFMPKKDLQLDTDKVAAWMESNGFVPVNTVDGIPEGYTPPDARTQQGLLESTLRGATIGQFVSGVDLPNDYARFLEYCAYRTVPYGKTFEEANLIGGAGEDWITGKKCREKSQQMSYFRVYTLDRSLVEGLDEDYTTPPVQASAVSGDGIRVASFNIRGASHDKEKPGSLPWPQRMIKTVAVINGSSLKDKRSIDIVGMQEVQAVQRAALKNQLPSYQFYPKNAAVQNPIMWNSEKYEIVKGAMMENLKYFNNKALRAPYVILKPVGAPDSEGFYVLNTHDPARQPYAEDRYDNAVQHRKFITGLKTSGKPIIFTGDFNSGFSRRSGGRDNITWRNLDKNLTYCILTQGGFMNNAFDMSPKRPVKCPNPGNDNAVDHVYVSPDITVNKFFKTGNNGSDVHDTQIADISLPSTVSASKKSTLLEKIGALIYGH